MRIGSLFSGAGGLDMAVEAAFAGHTVWHSEIDKAASKVLAYRWPDVPNLGSITEINWAEVEPVDVLCGGFPCQDVSAAGKRAGIKDGTRSGLWAVFAEAIGQLRPRFVVIENVRGLLSAAAHRAVESDDAVVGDGTGRPVLRAAGAVLGDLATLGYDAQWTTFAAADVGAPHRRERVFIVAHSPRNGRDEGRPEPARFERGFDAAVSGDEPGVALLPTLSACNANDGEGPETWLARREVVKARVKNGNGMGMPLAIAVQLLPTPQARDHKGTDSPGDHVRHSLALDAVTYHFPPLLPTPEAKNSHAGPDYARMNREGSGGHDLVTALTLLCTPSAADGAGGHLNRSGDRQHEQLLPGQAREMATAWGKYAPAIARWESLTRPAPPPTEPNKNGNPRLSAAFSEWLMGWPEGWVTDPAIGISRNDQLRIVGNGVCPQQATAALRMLLSVCEVSA